MSKEKDTNESTSKKEVRKYTRGREEVNLDDWLNTVSSGWDEFKNGLVGRTYTNSKGKKVKITEKDLSEIGNSYDKLFKRFNSGDNSLRYNYDTSNRGFTDTTGQLSSDSNVFDGIVAKYFGNTLRDMKVYKDPEPTPLVAPVDYGDGVLGKIFLNRMMGSNGTLQSFIDKDTWDTTTQTRGNRNRADLSRQTLEGMQADIKTGTGEFSKWTEEQRNKAGSDIDGLFTVFGDHEITDNEYLDLERILGLPNARSMYAVGKDTAPTTVTPDGEVQKSGRTYADFIRWVGRKYKPFTGTLIGPISLAVPETERYGESTTNSLSSAIQGSSIQDLHSFLQRVIGRNNYNVNNDNFIKKVFPTVNPGFSTQYVLGQVLNNLKGREGGLYNFGEDNLGTYFIPNTKTERNTGFVWDSNNNSISEMSIHNIPYWQAKIRSEWDSTDGNSEDDLDPSLTSSYQRFKQGGILYARGGSTLFDRNLGRGPGFTGDNPWLAVPNTAENAANLEMWDRYYNNAGIDTSISDALRWRQRPELPAPKLADDDPNATLVRQLDYMDLQDGNYSQAQLDAYLNDNYGPENVDKFWEYGYRVDDKGHPIKGEDGQLHGISARELGVYLNQLNQIGSGLSWDKNLNGTDYDAWNRKFDQTGLNMYFGGDSDKFKFMGPSTYNRHQLIQRMQNTYNKGNPLTIGDSSIYYDGRMWQMLMPEIEPTIPQIEAKIPDPSETKIEPLKTQPVDSDVKEINTVANTSSGIKGSKLLNAMSDYAPDLLGAGRLFASLRTNNKVAETIRPSLNPVLKDTYERYSPVTGAFSAKQLKNRQGAEALSQSHQAFTSDASLAAARMLEGQRQANQLQAEGFVADDQEIKRTQAEALARQEDNMARRSDVANFNRASINQTNREIAQLEATRLKSNWKSWDNFLGGVEQRVRTRADENRDRRLSFAETVADDNARREYEDLVKPANEALIAWQNEKDGNSLSNWVDRDKYTRFMKEAANRYTASRLSGRAGVYGYSYNNPYAKKSDVPFSWASFRKNGGLLQPRKPNFMAKIIKLNNERNS